MDAQVKESVGELKRSSRRCTARPPVLQLPEHWTTPEIKKALRLQEALQQALDDPAAEEALQHPALKPLLELTAD